MFTVSALWCFKSVEDVALFQRPAKSYYTSIFISWWVDYSRSQNRYTSYHCLDFFDRIKIRFWKKMLDDTISSVN